MLYPLLLTIACGIPVVLILTSCFKVNLETPSPQRNEVEVLISALKSNEKDPMQLFETIMEQLKGSFDPKEEAYIRQKMELGLKFLKLS